MVLNPLKPSDMHTIGYATKKVFVCYKGGPGSHLLHPAVFDINTLLKCVIKMIRSNGVKITTAVRNNRLSTTYRHGEARRFFIFNICNFLFLRKLRLLVPEPLMFNLKKGFTHLSA